MRALVTGITGFAGTHLAEQLLAGGDQVLGNSRRGVWPSSISDEVRRSVPLIGWDMTTPLSDSTRRTIEEFQPDTIFHLAAMSVPSDCGTTEPTQLAADTNVGAVNAVCELSRALSPNPRVVHVSSCYVYAPVSAEAPIVSEDSPLDPQHAYGKTKLLAEQEVLRAVHDDGVDVVLARAFQHAGPRQSPRMILPDWVRQFLMSEDEPIRVGCLNTYLDLSDVRDICRAYRKLAVDGQPGTVYNVGSGICRRSGDLFKMIEECTGMRRELIEADPRPRQHPIADIARLTQATGWHPETTLEETIRDTVEFWKQA